MNADPSEKKEKVERKPMTPEALAIRNEKRKKTCQEKYGKDHPMQTEEVKEKQRQVLFDKHGVRVPLKSPTIVKKMHDTVKDRYGVGNVAAIPEVREKMYATTLERHGVKHYNQLPEMKEYLRKNCREWLAESWTAGGPAKGITRPEEWNRKQRETVTKLIVEGNWRGGFKSNCSGRFPATKCQKTNPRFLSSLELIFHFYLNDNSNVEWYNYEPFGIPYQKTDGTWHNYLPDFLVKYEESDILHIFETKSWREKDSLDVLAKQNSALDYADQNGMTYTLFFDDDVQKLGFDLEKVKEYPRILFFKKQ